MQDDKALHNWSFEDVGNFCAKKFPESINLEYKEEIPDNNKLAKHIAAMANTLGGRIYIGIKEELDLPHEVIGIDIKSSKSNRNTIEQLVRNNINPVPEIQVFEIFNNDKSKSIIIIDIAASTATPHILPGGAIYLRTGQSSHPKNSKNKDSLEIRNAHLEDIQWLFNKRKASEDLRERLFNSSFTRFKNFIEVEHGMPIHVNFSCPNKFLADITSAPDNVIYIKNSVFFFFTGIKFPQKTLLDYAKTSEWILKINNQLGFMKNDKPPSPVEGGFRLSDKGSRNNVGGSVNGQIHIVDNFNYLELNEYGSLSKITNANTETSNFIRPERDISSSIIPAGNNFIKRLHFTKLVEQFVMNLKLIKSVYEGLDYYGVIDFRYFINKTNGCFAHIDQHNNELRSKISLSNIFNDYIAEQEDISLIEFSSNFDAMATKILKRFIHNLAITENKPGFIDDYIKDKL